MTNELKATILENRVSLLKARSKDNSNIVRALEREIRGLRKNV